MFCFANFMFEYVNSTHNDPLNTQEAAKVTNHVLEAEDKIYLKNLKNLKMKKNCSCH